MSNEYEEALEKAVAHLDEGGTVRLTSGFYEYEVSAADPNGYTSQVTGDPNGALRNVAYDGAEEALHQSIDRLTSTTDKPVKIERVATEKRYSVMVINDIFEGEHMLIIKWKGGTITERFDNPITTEIMHDKLIHNQLTIGSCDIYVVEGDTWKGEPRITKW